MAKYLLDTNVVLRLSNPSDDHHELVTEAIATLLTQGNECYLISQVLIELWVVATRPINVNGLGWSAEETHTIINQLLERFPFKEEVPQIFSTWLTLVTENQITGKRTHDVRIVATMIESGITHILTLNPKDFSGISGITVVHPKAVS
jgi:predicted nucleic acid-binding protein